MRKLIGLIFCVSLLVSCGKNSNENNDYWSCEQLLDTDGLKLYSFVPFTDEELRTLPYFEGKLPRRQIPEDFLHKMTTKELFYQVVYTDLSKSMGVFNTRQQGFEAVTQQLNMLPELLNRPDAGHVLLGLLKKVDPSKMNSNLSKDVDCFWWDYCLQIILAQTKIINRMTDEEIDRYIDEQLRCHDIIKSFDNEYPISVALHLFGLGNVMIRYNYTPFIKTLGKNPVTNESYWDTQFINEQYALQILDFVKQFRKVKR